MSARSSIEWTDATWTPIRARHRKTGKVGWHCEHATPGCEFCYSEDLNRRLGTGLPFKPGHRKDVELFLDETMLLAPLRWKRPRMVFVCSMTDLFADFVPDEWIDKIFAIMAMTPQHTFQVLTKRAERMRTYVGPAKDRILIGGTSVRVSTARSYHSSTSINVAKPWPLPNVWLGVSTEDQRRADERIPYLLATPAAVRFISAEPLLGQMDIAKYLRPGCDRCAPWETPCRIGCENVTRLDQVIVGGESGTKARPMHPDWARSPRDQCAAAGVPFFFKQWGTFKPEVRSGVEIDLTKLPRRDRVAANPEQPGTHIRFRWLGKKAAGRLLDGVEHNGMPEARK